MSNKYKNYSITMLMADGKEHIIPFAVPIGDKGDPGKSAYEIAVEYGFKGTEAEWLDSLKYGKDGNDGVSVTHSWNGTTLTVTSASGTSSVDLKGEKGDRGEKGERGVQGKSAYQVALDNGFTGSETEWIASLKGEDGADGSDGVSITEVKQTQISSLDGGVNVVRVTLSNGTQSQFQFKNGKKGSDGVDGKDYVLTETDKKEIASLVDIDTNKFVTTDTKQTIEGHKTFENAELKTATGSDTYLMNFTYQDMFDFNGGNDVGLVIKTEDGGYATFYKIPIVDGQTQTIATQEWVNENKSYVSNILSVTDAGHENVINFYPDGYFQIEMYGNEVHNCWYGFAEDEIVDDVGGTIATREWVQANAGGMKLDYLGDFAVETPSIDPNMYRGFMFQIGIDYDYGMAFDIVKSGMVFFEDLSWYAYGGGVYFPFTTSDLYRLGVIIDPFGNGGNADEKVVLQLAPNMDWTAYEIASNPFLGASHEGGQRVFVKIYGIKG